MYGLKKKYWSLPFLGVLVAVCLTVAVHAHFTSTFQYFPRLTTSLTPQQKEFISSLKKRGPIPGRLLVECSDEWVPLLGDMIPHWIQQPVLGGSNPGNNLISRFTVFAGVYWNGKKMVTDDPKIFNRSLKNMTKAEFSSYLQLYNVLEAAVFSRSSNEVFQKWPDLCVPVKRAGNYVLYEIKNNATWFIQGSAKLGMDRDEINLTHVSPGPLILKFHWIDTLKCDPSLPMTPVWIKDDPVPFISIDNSAEVQKIRIYNAGL
jgi:hypothetical protein